MVTYRPNETVYLVYVIDDASDTTTYYPRAVVRYSSDGTTFTTVNLTSAGSGRYTGSFQAPQDPNNSGTQIDVTITLYDDSGYTTINGSYRRQIERYLVQERWSTRFGLGGSGGELTKKEVREVVRGVFEEQNLSSIASSVKEAVMKEVEPALSKLKPSKQFTPVVSNEKTEKVDLSPLVSVIESLKKEIKEKIDNRVETKEEIYRELNLDPIKQLISQLRSKDYTGQFVMLEEKLNNFIKLATRPTTRELKMIEVGSPLPSYEETPTVSIKSQLPTTRGGLDNKSGRRELALKILSRR